MTRALPLADELHDDEPLRENGGLRKANSPRFAGFGVSAPMKILLACCIPAKFKAVKTAGRLLN